MALLSDAVGDKAEGGSAVRGVGCGVGRKGRKVFVCGRGGGGGRGVVVGHWSGCFVGDFAGRKMYIRAEGGEESWQQDNLSVGMSNTTKIKWHVVLLLEYGTRHVVSWWLRGKESRTISV